MQSVVSTSASRPFPLPAPLSMMNISPPWTILVSRTHCSPGLIWYLWYWMRWIRNRTAGYRNTSSECTASETPGSRWGCDVSPLSACVCIGVWDTRLSSAQRWHVRTINNFFSDNHSTFTALFQCSSYIATVGSLSIEASPSCARLECYYPIRSGHFTAKWQ